MLHQPITQTPNHARAAIFDAAAYVYAMRAAGATLRHVGGGSGCLTGTYTVETPAEPELRRRRIEGIDESFASQRAADPYAAARVAQHLFLEIATGDFGAEAAFEKVAGEDFGAALRELDRLKKEADAEDDEGRQKALDGLRDAGRNYVLSLPVKRFEDVHLKAEFAVRHCHWGDELQQVLEEIAFFHTPHLFRVDASAELFG